MSKRSRIIGSLSLLAALLCTTPANATPRQERSSRNLRHTPGFVVTNPRAGVTLGTGYRSLLGRRGVHARRGYSSGYYESHERRVWVPARSRQVYVAPVFEFRLDDCNVRLKVQVGGGYTETVIDPGYYETRIEQVWVPAPYGGQYGHHGHKSRGHHGSRKYYRSKRHQGRYQ